MNNSGSGVSLFHYTCNECDLSLTLFYHCPARYCLDVRDAISKDSQLSHLQSSHVKHETLSSFVQTDRKPLETRCTRAATKAVKKDKKPSLMKLSVPLNKTAAAGKGRKPASLIGRLDHGSLM